MFKERKTKFALLSLLSALAVASTAFAGVSIYAQTDDSELTTFEEEANASGEQFEDTMSNATSEDHATEDMTRTSAADVQSLLDGLVVCDLGTAEVSDETEAAGLLEEEESGTTPTVSVTVMSETEVAALASNETETASAGDETSTTSASCISLGGGNETSSNGNAEGEANATSTASDNSTSADNATSTSNNMTGTDNATSTSTFEEESNATSTAADTSHSDREILVIEGQDFTPGQVVLIFSENSMLGIDDVDDNGEIDAKVPMPISGETEVAGNDSATTELRFVESGTQRSATFEFDGETLTAAEGDIEAEDGEDDSAATAPSFSPAPSNDAGSTNSTSTTNSTNATMQ